MNAREAEDRFEGLLLGAAIGDALGLAAEGLPAHRLERRFGRLARYRLLGARGFVSDDTEHTALVAHALLEQPEDPALCARAFARRLRGWALRLPFGAGGATLASCFRLLVGVSPERSGSRSAGNGAAMRAAVVGAVHAGAPERRQAFSRALARVTHDDPLAVEGADYVASLAAQAMARGPAHPPDLLSAKEAAVTDARLGAALGLAARLARDGASTREAARSLGTGGFVLETVPFAAFVFARHGGSPRLALEEAVNAGGDTDTIGAIVGALVGARHGQAGLPRDLVDALEDGPLGRSHLRELGRRLAVQAQGQPSSAPPYSAPRLMARNALLLPVILGHAFARALPDAWVRRLPPGAVAAAGLSLPALATAALALALA